MLTSPKYSHDGNSIIMSAAEIKQFQDEQAAAKRIIAILINHFGEIDSKTMMIKLVEHIETEKDERKIEIFRQAIALVARKTLGQL